MKVSNSYDNVDEDVFRSLFENMQLGFSLHEVITDDSGKSINFKFLLVNKSYEKIINKSYDEVVGKTMLEINPDADKKMIEKYCNIGLTGIPAHIEYFSKSFNKYISVNAFSPKIGQFATVFEDITEMKQIENNLKQSKKRLYNVLNNIDAVVFQIDKKGKYIFSEGRELKKNGFKPKEVLGLTCFEVFKKDQNNIDGFRKVLSGEFCKFESEVNGSNFQTSLNPTFDEYGKCDGAIGIAMDITEIKSLEQELIKEKDITEKNSINKTEFIAKMSHELRTPINVVFSAVQLFELYMKNDSVIKKEKYESHLGSMKQNCFRLLRLVNNLIAATKIDSGSYEDHFGNHNIFRFIESIALSVSEYAKQKNIKLTFESNIEDGYISCDIDMIEHIMLNIISNAIKFTKDIIIISLTKRDNNIIIMVKDNGKGIEIEKHELIFERYKQASNLFIRENEGIGIGLYLTKMLIEMHGGNISVKSDRGRGCEFIIELPIKVKIDKDDEVNNINYDFDKEAFIGKMNVEFSDIYK